ncbi:hypothetical protein L484_018926 [Morus notabilis]|uniref:Uncharacterized protein n=1 Tax=Morus notabilis TaxID=981085 RepID=W9QRM6_9ROSA|nr:hypothetical protein L484_018926 [Morus notabilis]
MLRRCGAKSKLKKSKENKPQRGGDDAQRRDPGFGCCSALEVISMAPQCQCAQRVCSREIVDFLVVSPSLDLKFGGSSINGGQQERRGRDLIGILPPNRACRVLIIFGLGHRWAIRGLSSSPWGACHHCRRHKTWSGVSRPHLQSSNMADKPVIIL